MEGSFKLEKLFKDLSAVHQVESIALGGSRAESDFDDKDEYWEGRCMKGLDS